MSDQIIDLYATQSPTKSLDTGEGFFPEAPGVKLLDGAILFTWRDDATQDDPAGTGNFDPFLSFQNSTDEIGTNFYNGSTHGTGDAIIAADNRTSLLKTEVVPVITVGGIEYYEFRLDVNESGGQESLLSLESFKIFGSNSATETGDGLDPLYSIDANGINTTINIWDDNSGSGRSDVVMLIPKSYFTSDPEYLYFEAKLSGTDAGFEEFSIYVLQQVPDPQVELTKTADVWNEDETDDIDNIVDSAGDVIRYTVSVSNTGNVSLNPTVLDSLVSLDNDATDDGVIDGDTNDNALLDVGETWIFKGEYTVTQADLDKQGNYDGSDIDTINDQLIRNIATVTTTQGVTDQDIVDTPTLYNPSISLLKVSDVFNDDMTDDLDDVVDAAGDVINYIITAENTGNITLTNPLLNDPLVASLDDDTDDDGVINGDTNENGLLDVGETWSWTGSYTVTQADLDARGNYDSEMDSDEINDDLIRNDVSVNTDQGASDEAFAQNSIAYDPEISLLKTSDVFNSDSSDDDDDVIDTAGDVIKYTVTTQNTGNITLTNVALVDPLLGSLDNDSDDDGFIDGDSNQDGKLDVGETWSWTGSYTVTQADLDARGNYDSEMDSDEINDDLIRNDVSVNTDQGASDEAFTQNELIYDPDLGVIKMANVELVDEAGDIIVYTIAVKNEGNITLDGVSLNDAMLVSNLTNDFDQNGVIDGDQNENGLLDVGETWTWTGEYMVTEEDIQAAMMSTSPFFINNTAYADSNQTDEESASETVSVQVYFEGLSHGYWKNHQSDWDGVSSSTSFEEFFFGSQESSLQWLIKNGMSNKPKFVNKNDITFDQALDLTGGGEAALAREAVAAILNIRDEDVTYRYTEEQVKEWVVEALTGQAVDLNNDGINEFAAGMDAIAGVKDLLDMNNNLELV